MNKLQTANSQKISHALRHQPEKYGLILDVEGWCSIKDLSTLLSISIDDIKFIVENNDKKRFAIENNKIRANQGHSLSNIKIKYSKIENDYPEMLYHGTKTSNLKSILKDGLKRSGRQYVHLSLDEKTAKNVASRRKGNSVLIEIKTSTLIEQGLFLSSNGVYLTIDISPDKLKVLKYF